MDGATILRPSAKVLDEFCKQNPGSMRIEAEAGRRCAGPVGLVAHRQQPRSTWLIRTCRTIRRSRAAWGRN
jgi:hypothetical protein